MAQVFTRPVFSAAAREGSGRAIRDALNAAGIKTPQRSSLAPTLDGCIRALQDHYRCEYVYKSAVADRVVFGRHSPRTASLHVELPVERSIVDLAVFNGTSTAYEIKTEFDSEKRLVTQTSSYLKAFERVYVVCHPNLAERCMRTTDPAVGVLVLSGRGRLTTVRSALENRERLELKALMRLLRVGEYQEALERFHGAQPAVPNGARFAHYSRLWSELSVEQAHQAVVASMRRRTTRTDTADFICALPQSLRVLGYSTPLTTVQRQRLLNVLH